MNYKAAGKLRDILMVAGAVIMLLAYVWEPFIVIGAVICCSCLIPHFLFFRCPHCGKHLGRQNGKFCQYCGRKLDQ